MVPNRGEGFDSFPGAPDRDFRYSPEDGRHDQGQLHFAYGDYLPPSYGQPAAVMQSSSLYASPSTSPFRAVPNPSYAGHVEDVYYVPPKDNTPINRSIYIPPAVPSTNSAYSNPPPCCIGGIFQGNHHPRCPIALQAYSSALNQSPQYYPDGLSGLYDDEVPILSAIPQFPQRSSSTQPLEYPSGRGQHLPHRMRSHSMPMGTDDNYHLRAESPLRQVSHVLPSQVRSDKVTGSSEDLATSMKAEKAAEKPYTRQFTLSHNRALEHRPS